MTAEHTGPLHTSMATLAALEIARALTDYKDTRLPDALPDEPDQLRRALKELESRAVEYTWRAGEEGVVLSFERAHRTLLHHREAGQIARLVLAYAQTAVGDPRPAIIEAELLLIGVLTWRLTVGERTIDLERISVAAAVFLAGSIAAEQNHPTKVAADNINAADRMLHSATAAMAATSPLAEQARDAYALGLDLLRVGETDRARRWLSAAQILGVANATTVLPSLAGAEDDDEERIDFATHPDLWRQRADLVNRTVTFHPADGVESTTDPQRQDAVPLPCLEVAGVQVYGYLDGTTGRLRVSVDLDTTQPWLLSPEQTVPLEISVQGTTVYVG